MNSIDKYPLFIPPAHLSIKGRANWNAKEATEYREWLLGVIDKRTEELIKKLEEPSAGTPSEHLMALGRKVTPILFDIPFSEITPSGRRLTNNGYALAADMGLMVAKYLLQKLPDKLRWETIRKPKSELSYNLPVLKGFSLNYLEPIGGSISEASAILRNQRGPDTWKRIYEFWLEKN